MPPATPDDATRALLERERADLQALIDALHGDDAAIATTQQQRERASDPAGGDGDQESVARGAIKTQLHKLHSRLHNVDTALAALDRGEYGRCAGCGDEIAPARLEALPGVATCITCAR